jgi:hypothetical protein
LALAGQSRVALAAKHDAAHVLAIIGFDADEQVGGDWIADPVLQSRELADVSRVPVT